MVASVLVNLFSKLTDQGDKSQMHLHDRIQAMITEQWQHHFQHDPSNSELLSMLVCWDKKHQSLTMPPSFVRYAHDLDRNSGSFCDVDGVLKCVEGFTLHNTA